MKTLALIFAVLLTTLAAVLLGWQYQDRADALFVGVAVGLLCGAAWGALVAGWVTRRPRTRSHPPVVVHYPGGITVLDMDAPVEVSPAALEWHEATHG